MECAVVGKRHKKVEILQIHFPRQTDTAGNQIPWLAFEVAFHEMLCGVVCFEIRAQSGDQLLFPLSLFQKGVLLIQLVKQFLLRHSPLARLQDIRERLFLLLRQLTRNCDFFKRSERIVYRRCAVLFLNCFLERLDGRFVIVRRLYRNDFLFLLRARLIRLFRMRDR